MTFSIYLLQCVAFVDLLAVSLIVPLIASHVRTLGADHVYVGLMGSIYSGFQLASGPLLGSLSDLKGRKVILTVTLLICGLAYAIMGITSSLVVILIVRAILGLFKQTQVLAKALVPDYERSEKKQSEIYGKMAAISGVGMTIGPIIGGHMAEDHPEEAFKLIATLVGICFIANAGLVCLLPKSISDSQKAKKPVQKQVSSKGIVHIIVSSCKESVLELYKIEWSKYGTIFFFKGLLGFAMSLYYSNYVLYLKTTYELTPRYIGYIISFQGIIGSICSFYMGYINSFYTKDKDYSVRNFHVFLVLSLSILGLIVSFNIYMYAFFLIPLAIGNAVGRLVTLEMILKRSHNTHRATLIGASNSVRSISGVVAPMAAGLIGQYYSVQHVVYVTLFVTFLGTLASYRHKNKRVKQD
ncbi:major facilitator superfamily domain-containing protein 9-like [Leguminivora glycinivorella]|uniref:major facilitator superfamily domain-containing protein 9-like n=1 Tax=Leguminivora glycinivorella TaxID=1035111 RepID=UPI002010A476|nr:major facilitator superfamily domain-containing protein 9-like [Leguminivora glycinivorella]